MTGVEVLAGAAVAYLMRKAGRAGKRADSEVDRVLDEGMDRLHGLITEKLGADPALERLQEQARDSADVPERTERRAVDAIADAAQDDEGFAARLGELVEALQQREDAAGGTPAAGTVSNVISGGTHHGPVFQGRDFGSINIGPAPASSGETTEGDGPTPAN